MSSLSRPKSKSKQREPPTLFLHPSPGASPGASHVSLPGILAPGASVPTTGLRRENSLHESIASVRHGSAGQTDGGTKGNRTLRTPGSGRGADRTDALWAEMQATLEEVELSATGGTHVFGPEHDKKLAELRAAQISLAQAWARSEADSGIDIDDSGDGKGQSGGDEVKNSKSTTDGIKASAGDGEEANKGSNATRQKPSLSGGDVEQLGFKLEEETESDILLARKRREANDVYFQRVNNGVLDVVSKLEQVAVAMRAVEQESKEVWHENENEGGV